jgi:hypothetical protein
VLGPLYKRPNPPVRKRATQDREMVMRWANQAWFTAYGIALLAGLGGAAVAARVGQFLTWT